MFITVTVFAEYSVPQQLQFHARYPLCCGLMFSTPAPTVVVEWVHRQKVEVTNAEWTKRRTTKRRKTKHRMGQNVEWKKRRMGQNVEWN